MHQELLVFIPRLSADIPPPRPRPGPGDDWQTEATSQHVGPVPPAPPLTNPLILAGAIGALIVLFVVLRLRARKTKDVINTNAHPRGAPPKRDA